MKCLTRAVFALAALSSACSTTNTVTSSADASVDDATAPGQDAGGNPKADARGDDSGEPVDAGEAGDAAVAGWSKHFGGTDRDVGVLAAVDSAGNVYVTGEFIGTGAFGGAPIDAQGGSDVFLTKLSPTGAVIWSKAFGGAADESPTALAVDANGIIYLGGWFVGEVDFGFGSMASPDDFSTFVLRLDATGTPTWSKKLDLALAYGAALDKTGGVVLTGSFAGTADFGTGPHTSRGGEDIFVTRLDTTNGATTWGFAYGSPEGDGARAIAMDSMGRSVIIGQFQGTIDFAAPTRGPGGDAGTDGGDGGDAAGADGGDAGISTSALVSAGGYDAYFAKFDTNGKLVESRNFGGADGNSANHLALETNDDMRVTGSFVKSMSFGGAATLICASCDFVAKLDSHGTHVWSQKLDSPQFTAVAVDAQGQTFLTGGFSGTLNLGGGVLSHADAGALNFDAFAAKLDATGKHVWSKQGGTTASGNGIAVTPTGEIVLVGGFMKMLDLGPTTLVGNPAGFDTYVIKLSP